MSFAVKNLINAPILKNCMISVVIPVRDEAAFLQKTLESFLKQTDLRGVPLDGEIFEIIVLLNNCRDDSVKIARKFQTENPQLNLHICEIELPAQNCNSGFVRRLLMDEAFFRLEKNGGVIMTTDGDTRVSADWIAANLSEIERGADAVGGRILFSENELDKMNPAAREFYLIDEQYRLLAAELESFLDFLPHDAAPRHYQHFNGSFAVTTEIYKSADGIPDVSCMEDVAFFQSLMRIDAKFRHSPIVKVFTSARNKGRTEAGLSTQINDWQKLAERGEDFLVESAEAVVQRLKARNKLRQIWQNSKTHIMPNKSEVKKLAEDFCISFKCLSDELKNRQTFGILLENISRKQVKNCMWNKKFPPVPVGETVVKLEQMLKKLRSDKRKTAAA